MNATLALQGRGLGLRYRTAAPVFAGVSIDVFHGEIVALLGASGCGKSSLLRLLAGLSAPTEGEVEFLGQRLAAPHPRAALVFQQAALLPWLSVEANVGFGLDFKHQPKLGRAERQSRIAAALEAVGLAGEGGLHPSQLSGGMAQRVALARALARQPRLLLADEPFSALDAVTRAGMQDLLVDVVRRWDTAALLVTHDIDEAILVADRIVLMGGRPGTVQRTWHVGIDRPRTADPDRVAALRLEILQALRDPSLLS